MFPVLWGSTIKNILRTDVLKSLKESGCRIVILSYETSTPEFIQEFSDSNVIIEKLVKHKPSLLEMIFSGIAERIYRNRVDNKTLRIIDKLRIRKNGVAGFFMIRVLGALVGTSLHIMNLAENIYLNAFSDKYYEYLFQEYSPDLYFSPEPYHIDQLPLFRRCLKEQVPIIAMIHSWDNVTNHGKLPMRFPKIIVWNEILKKELGHFFGYSPDHIYISGVPQFDRYYNYQAIGRINFFNKLGCNTDKKLITYTTAASLISPKEEDILELLCKSVINDDFELPVSLLIRMHPQDDMVRYEKLDKYKNTGKIIFESAGKKSTEFPDNWSPTEDNINHYADILFHSDVMINVASTVTIEAAIFDTPIVNVVYDGYENVDYYESAVRHYDFLHYRNIVTTGGVKLAKNHQELVQHVNQYLKDPSLDNEGRARIVEQQCYKIDGMSGKRIAQILLDQMNEKC